HWYISDFSILLCSITPPPPCSTLFPYTTLFRSVQLVFLLLSDVKDVVLGNLLRGQDERQSVPDVVDILRRHRDLGKRTLRREYRSEEHTSELQSRGHLVCRLLLEKKNTNKTNRH